MPKSNAVRRGLVLACGALLVVAALAPFDKESQSCGRVIDHPQRPLANAVETSQQDPRVARLVAAVEAMPAPFGAPVGAVGYDEAKPLRLGVAEDSLLAWTGDSQVWAVLDPRTLKPRWGATAPLAGMAWDASPQEVYALSPFGEVAARNLKTGAVSWCAHLPHRTPAELIETSVSAEELVVAIRRGSGTRIFGVDRADGSLRWQLGVPLESAALLRDGEMIVVGGVGAEEAWSPSELAQRTEPAVQVMGVNPSGVTSWTKVSPAGTNLQVAAYTPGGLLVAVEASTSGGRILGLDQGREVWHTKPLAGVIAVAVRGSIVLARNETSIVGLDAATGTQLWRTPVRGSPQQFPDGFALADAPYLDPDTVLLGGTDAVIALRLADGTVTSHPLPTDGTSTTYWPRQIVVTQSSIGIVTNTASVVARRTD